MFKVMQNLAGHVIEDITWHILYRLKVELQQLGKIGKQILCFY